MNGEHLRPEKMRPDDIGKWVAYKDGAGEFEYGRIKSFTSDRVFVVYAANDEWDNYTDYTAAGTRYEDLYWFGEPGKAIICPRCNWVSHHPDDVRHKYCAHCKLFHDQLNIEDLL